MNRLGEGLQDALTGLAGAWIRKHSPRCDWCFTLFREVSDLAAYLEFCSELPKLWPATRKGLPKPKVFCRECAAGAICELIDGVTYHVGAARLQESDPWTRARL